jgi:hexosaminidase
VVLKSVKSWPIKSVMFQGAYHPDLTYEPQEVQAIMNYARDRGIRVILEFETPGHTVGFSKAFPRIHSIVHI